jgi:cytochrome b561
LKDITARAATFLTAGHRRYDATARAFHWITALLIFIIVPLGWIFAEFKKPPFDAGALYASWHKTLGLVVLALVVARLIWRLTNPPPVLPGRMAVAERWAAYVSHWLLYAVLFVMPISGYIMSSAGKRPITIAGLFDFPKAPVSETTGKLAESIHLTTQWAVYGLVLLHILAVAWHLSVRRDDILARMLPRQINAD